MTKRKAEDGDYRALIADQQIASRPGTGTLHRSISENMSVTIFVGPGYQRTIARSVVNNGEPAFAERHFGGGRRDMLIPKTGDLFATKLFIRWLSEGQYVGLESLVPLLEVGQDLHWNYNFRSKPRPGGKLMPWAVKAAILAFQFARQYGAPGFQKYALQRLYAALAKPDHKVFIEPELLEYLQSHGRNPATHLELVGAYVIQHWGDPDVVDHTDNRWPRIIGRDENLNTAFFQVVAKPLEMRRLDFQEVDPSLTKEN